MHVSPRPDSPQEVKLEKETQGHKGHDSIGDVAHRLIE